jgi:uncharacterized membrane protein
MPSAFLNVSREIAPTVFIMPESRCNCWRAKQYDEGNWPGMMTMLYQLALTSLAAAAILFPMDFMWLRTMRPFYESQIGDALLQEPRIAVAAGFYLLYTIGIAFFVVRPNIIDGTVWSALAQGAFFGLVAYGVYDLTNYATLKTFPLQVVMVDLTWGTVLTAVTAGGAWLIRNWLG